MLPADTVFFPEGVARAVQGLDPDVPYFLSGKPDCYPFLSRKAAMPANESSRLTC